MDKVDRTILIIEDDEDLLTIVKDVLEGAGYKRVLTASTAKQGMELALQNPTLSAILCDLNLAEMDGTEIYAQLMSKGMDVPFVILTGEEDKRMILKALRLGITDYLNKPIARKDLLEVISRMVELGVRKTKIRSFIGALAPGKALAESEIKGFHNDIHFSALLRIKNSTHT